MESRRRLIIVDDHKLVAQGIAGCLAPHYEIAGIAHSGGELLELLARDTPDCVLLDLTMPGRSGFDLLSDLCLMRPELKILILTMHLDRVLAEACINSGARGYVPKECTEDDLLLAISEVLAGRIHISPLIPRRTDRVSLKAAHPSLASLTPRQHEILHLIGRGESTALIAAALRISDKTVEFHRANLRQSLGIATEWGLTRYALLMKAAEAERRGAEADQV